MSRNTSLRATARAAPAAVSEVLAVGVVPTARDLALTSATPLRVAGTVTPAKPRITLDIYRHAGQHRQLLTSQRVTAHGGAFSVRPALGARRGRHYVLIARTVAGGGTLAGASPPLAVIY